MTKTIFACVLSVCILSAAPQGARAADNDLPFIAPKTVAAAPYTVELTPGAAVKIALKGNTYVLTSEFSTIPGWAKLEEQAATGFNPVKVAGSTATAETASFTLKREIRKQPECVEVCDTLTNKSGENLPVIIRHQARLPDFTSFRLGGRKIALKRAQAAEPQNPTTIVLTPTGSVGLLALDDAFRIHVLNYGLNGVFGVADQNRVLAPHASTTVRFAIFPSDVSDYYAQINAMRRFLGVNFRIDGGFAFGGGRVDHEKNNEGRELLNRKSSLEDFKTFIGNKDAKFCPSSRVERYKGKYAEGPDWLMVANADFYKEQFAREKEAVPWVQTALYFSNNFYAAEDGKEKYAECRLMNPDGSQADYRDPNYPLWLAIDGNAYAKDLEKTLDFIMFTVGTDGVYWDEFERSAADYHFGDPWDGVSADIDPQTHQITRLKSSVTLLTQPWRLKQVDRIMAAKKYLIINGAPTTDSMLKAMANYKVPRFTETGSITNCLGMHLYSPIALGDHVTERTDVDCYRWMLQALNFGCVYYWYSDQVVCHIHPNLGSYMFPITPVELGEGYIIGKERILTAKSGLFSFGDAAPVETHFFNAQGVETPKTLPTVVKDGKTYYKVELEEFESCALVRKDAQ